MKDDGIFLKHIAKCIRRIEEFTGAGHAEFLRDEKTQDAILRNLQTLAESATRLSDSARQRSPEVDWHGISGFRNVLVHNYLGINLERVWTIIEQDLPVLRRAVDDLRKD